HVDLAAEQAGDLARNGEPEPGSAVLAAGGAVGLLECLEDDLLLVPRDPDPGVDHREPEDLRGALQRLGLQIRPVVAGVHHQPDLALLRELERVRQQVLEDLLSASSLARISSELSGVRSSWLMFARNSLLYLEISESCSAFSSRLARANSTSRFFTSMFVFCSSSCLAFSSSSSACFSSAALLRFSSSCWMVSSLDWVCSSC